MPRGVNGSPESEEHEQNGRWLDGRRTGGEKASEHASILLFFVFRLISVPSAFASSSSCAASAVVIG